MKDAHGARARYASLLPVGLVCLSVLLAFLQLRLTVFAVYHQHPGMLPRRIATGDAMTFAAVLALPFPIVTPAMHPSAIQHALDLATGFAESCVLFALVRALRRTHDQRVAGIAVSLASAATILVAVASPVLTSLDAYAYAGYAQLGSAAAYHPPLLRFAGSYAAVNAIWGAPLVPCVYGPLWEMLAHAVAGGATTLHAAIVDFRLLGVFSYAVLIAALIVRRVPFEAVAITALNPALANLYVANAHNDLMGAALIAAALAVVEIPLLAALLVAGAALVKLPFVVFALVVFAGRGPLRSRIAYVVVAVVLALAGSLVLGGAPYVHAVVDRLFVPPNDSSAVAALGGRVLRLVLVVVSMTALITAFLRRTIVGAATWSLSGVGALLPVAWYLCWGIPYAMLERRTLVLYLAALPFSAAVLNDAFSRTGIREVGIVVIAILGIAGFTLLRTSSLRIDGTARLPG